jgi:hypothetical protein
MINKIILFSTVCLFLTSGRQDSHELPSLRGFAVARQQQFRATRGRRKEGLETNSVLSSPLPLASSILETQFCPLPSPS